MNRIGYKSHKLYPGVKLLTLDGEIVNGTVSNNLSFTIETVISFYHDVDNSDQSRLYADVKDALHKEYKVIEAHYGWVTKTQAWVRWVVEGKIKESNGISESTK